MAFKKREEHWNWKGGRIKQSGKYISILKPNHPFATKQGYVREHRLVKEAELGRYLTKEEIIHHINGIPDDNRPENLEVTVREKHTAQHNITHGECSRNKKGYNKKWSRENKEWKHNWHLKNKEKVKEQINEWRKKHPNYQKEHRQKNLEKVRKYEKEYRAKKKVDKITEDL